MTDTKTAEERALDTETYKIAHKVMSMAEYGRDNDGKWEWVYRERNIQRLAKGIKDELKAHAEAARRDLALTACNEIAGRYAQPVRVAHSENASDGAWDAIRIIQEQLAEDKHE